MMQIRNVLKLLHGQANAKVTIIENEEEYVEILQVAFRILQFYRLWPSKEERSNSLIYKIKALITMCLFSLTGTCNVMYIIHVFWAETNYLFADVFESIVIIGTTIGIYLVFARFLQQIPVLELLIKDIGRFGEFGKPPLFNDTNRKMNKILFIFALYGFMAVGVYVGFSLLDKQKCEEISQVYDLDRLCGFMTWMRMPYISLDHFPNNVIFWIIQVGTCASEVSCCTLLITWFYAIVEMYLTRIAHLKEMVMEIDKMTDKSTKRAQLNKCIRYHIYILGLSDQINECLGGLFFLTSALATLVISLVGTLYLIAPELYTFFHGMGWVLFMFILCYTGQRILDESDKIPIDIYSFDWFECDITMQKDIILFLMCSNRPLHLKAAGFFVVDFNTFTWIMKTAYSFLALLQQSLEED